MGRFGLLRLKRGMNLRCSPLLRWKMKEVSSLLLEMKKKEKKEKRKNERNHPRNRPKSNSDFLFLFFSFCAMYSWAEYKNILLKTQFFLTGVMCVF